MIVHCFDRSGQPADGPLPLEDDRLSSWAAIRTIVITNVGGGILLLPGLLKNVGWASGLAFLLIASGSTTIAFLQFAKALAKARRDHTVNSMGDVARALYPQWGGVLGNLIDGLLYTTLFAISVVYLNLIVGSAADLLMEINTVTLPLYTSQIICLIFAIPSFLATVLSSSKFTVYMKHASFIAISALAVLVVVTLAGSFQQVGTHGLTNDAHAFHYHDIKGYFGVFATYVFSLAAVVLLPDYSLKMQDAIVNDHDKMRDVIVKSQGISSAAYLVAMLVPYLAWGDNVQANVLDSMKGQMWAWYTAKVLCLIHAMAIQPIIASSVNDFLERKCTLRWVTPQRMVVFLAIIAFGCNPISFFPNLVGLVPSTLLLFLALIIPTVLHHSSHEGERSIMQNTTGLLICAIALWTFVCGEWNAVSDLMDKIAA